MSVVAEVTEIADIAEKVRVGERLSFEDGVRLFRTRDIHTLGELATLARERLHGRTAYYNINRHINYSNICVLRCKFCSFYRPYPKGNDAAVAADLRVGRGRPARTPAATAQSADVALPMAGESSTAFDATSEDTYELSVDQIVDQAREAHEHGATEVHIVGGLHPNCRLTITSTCAGRSKPPARTCTSKRLPPSRLSTLRGSRSRG
jgi:aminodeoxyfutalosine synthase